ncbi:MAG: type II secretion system protein [Ruminococcus sp.]|nr:type II secretion system protein [Ruminococcus sp.]
MKKLKGFTLVELIIVMAILAILMASIMQMYKPIRETYVDATLYENQRTVQNGMIQYVSESVRYATNMGLYTSDKKGTVKDAVDAFADAYISANNIVDVVGGDAKATNTKEAIERCAEVIIFDYKTGYTYNNVSGWKGRILRRKFIPDSSYSSTDPAYKKYQKITNDAEDPTKTSECRMALGDAYYGDRNYFMTLECGDPTKPAGDPWVARHGIKITVASSSKIGRVTGGIAEKGSHVTTAGEVLCKNLSGASDHGVSKAGIFDIDNFNDAVLTAGGSTKVYIVYLNPGEDGIEAVRSAHS